MDFVYDVFSILVVRVVDYLSVFVISFGEVLFLVLVLNGGCGLYLLYSCDVWVVKLFESSVVRVMVMLILDDILVDVMILFCLCI